MKQASTRPNVPPAQAGLRKRVASLHAAAGPLLAHVRETVTLDGPRLR